MATTSTSLQAAFSKVSVQDKADYDRFLEYTNNANISSYSRGSSLTALTELAEKAWHTVQVANPLKEERFLMDGTVPMMQWDLDRLSEIKGRLAKAIECKRSYYDNHFFGIVTKYVLKLFRMWHEGDTADIQCAEDFLIRYDSRLPMEKDAQGNYRIRNYFFGGWTLVNPLSPIRLPSPSAEWVRQNLNVSRFHNYNPKRAIVAAKDFHYSRLDPRNPEVVIRSVAQST